MLVERDYDSNSRLGNSKSRRVVVGFGMRLRVNGVDRPLGATKILDNAYRAFALRAFDVRYMDL